MDKIEGAPVVVARGGPESSPTEIAVAEALGGAVMRLFIGGRDWLFRNVATPLSARLEARVPGDPIQSAYVDRGDIGLGDLCFPTVGGCHVEVDRVDHGDLWYRRPVVTASGSRIETAWRRDEPPAQFVFTRTMTIVPSGAVQVDLRVENTGARALPAIFSTHDMFDLDGETRYELPLHTPISLFAAHGFLPDPEGGHRWPAVRLAGGGALDLSDPESARESLGRDFAVKLFTTDPNVNRGAIVRGDQRLTLEGDRGFGVGLWINWRGWAPDSLRARYQREGVALKSTCLELVRGGPTDLLSEAIERRTAIEIAPRGVERWTYRLRAGS